MRILFVTHYEEVVIPGRWLAKSVPSLTVISIWEINVQKIICRGVKGIGKKAFGVTKAGFLMDGIYGRGWWARQESNWMRRVLSENIGKRRGWYLGDVLQDLQGAMPILGERLGTYKIRNLLWKGCAFDWLSDDREALAYDDARQCSCSLICADNQRDKPEESLYDFLTYFVPRSQSDRSCVESNEGFHITSLSGSEWREDALSGSTSTDRKESLGILNLRRA